jgi:hypothetical protein
MDKHIPTNSMSPKREDCLRLAEIAEKAASEATLPNVRLEHLQNAERWRLLARPLPKRDALSIHAATGTGLELDDLLGIGSGSEE